MNERARPRAKADKKKKKDINAFEIINALFDGRELVPSVVKSGILQLKSTKLFTIYYLQSTIYTEANASKINNSNWTSKSR